MLNALRHYFVAAIVPVLLNIVLIVVLVVALARGYDQPTTGLWLAGGVLVSGFVQLALLAFAVARHGFSPRFAPPRLTRGVRRLMVLMAPAMLTGGVTQINLLVGQIIASAQDGAIALLNYADRINQLPLGVIGIAIGVVLLPELARSLKAGDEKDAQHLQNRSLEFALGLTLPATVGLMLMPAPIVGLLYERGAFTETTTAMTAAALAAFAAGLPAYVLLKVFQPAFFAREDMKTPMWFSIVAVIINIAGSLALFPRFGHVGIAAATAVSAWANFVLLAVTLWLRDHFRPSGTTLRRLVFIALASAVMGGVIVALNRWLADWLDGPGVLARAGAVLLVIAAAAFVYFTIVIATGAVDRRQLARLVRRRRS
jgi:putative peptidoglycan lipid II flippase